MNTHDFSAAPIKLSLVHAGKLQDMWDLNQYMYLLIPHLNTVSKSDILVKLVSNHKS